MEIRIVGNGGALNDGLPYNSFMVDDYFLAEIPPDIMTSLFREEIDLRKIKVIYISHFHGDHYFGLPFLILKLFVISLSELSDSKIKLLGPAGLKNKAKEICRLALGDNHPVHKWIEDKFIFIELESGSNLVINSELSLKIFPMDHFIETFGFSLYRNSRILFTYFADTLWNDELISQVKLFPELIIVDLNGEPSDPVKVHMSEDDVIEKVLPLSENRITFYGTHLKNQKESVHKKIKYVKPGEIILLKSDTF